VAALRAGALAQRGLLEVVLAQAALTQAALTQAARSALRPLAFVEAGAEADS
jgi:hypothetical protein